MSDRLQTKSSDFVDRLNNLIGGCVADAPLFGVVDADSEQRLRIGPLPFETDGSGFSLIPLMRTCDGADQPPLMLKIEFHVSLDDESNHLAVQQSTYGLWVRPAPRRKRRPVFRIEYNRDAYNKPVAHVHLHAESMEFGWIYGTAGLRLPRLFEIHFPVGGRRFRPTVEELLQFLNREKLFVDWLPGWNQLVERSLKEWERNQARATVRQHTEAAVGQLRDMDYEVTPPQ